MTENFESKPESARRRTGRLAVAAVAVAALSFGAGGYVFSHDTSGDTAISSQAYSIVRLPAEGFREIAAVTKPAVNAPHFMEQGSPFSFADLVEHISPAVVTVVVDRETTQRGGTGGNLDDIPAPFRDFFRQFGQGNQGNDDNGGRNNRPQTFKSEAMGSGFIIDPSGYIVTNNHVIEDGKKITVKMPGPSGREFTAHLVGTDKDTDIALLKIDGVHDLPTVAFGDDHHLRVGDWVVAVGNPFGLGGTVTAGIVSSIGRDIGSGPYTDYIQIDAPINQGNSGGPTFDLSGRVVGMNTAIFSPSGGSVGIGFAIPASTIKSIVEQLREHGNVSRGWLGVDIQSLTPDMAASLGVKTAKGAIVASVVDASPAAKAGFKQGDVILALNGSDVDDNKDLTRKVASLRVGERAQFAVLRDGQKYTLTAMIAKRDDEKLASADNPAKDRGDKGANHESSTTVLGLGLSSLTDQARQEYNIDDKTRGVVVSVVDPNSEAADKGFRPGDVIVGIGNHNVRTPADIQQGVAEAKRAGRETVLLLVASDQGERYVALKVAKG